MIENGAFIMKNVDFVIQDHNFTLLSCVFETTAHLLLFTSALLLLFCFFYQLSLYASLKYDTYF